MRTIVYAGILLLGLCSLWIRRSESLVISSTMWRRSTPRWSASSEVLMTPNSLQKIVLVVPKQSNGDEYEAALYDQVAKEKVVRWYVSRISGETAEIEAIVEEKGVGNSAINYKAKQNHP